MTASGGQQGISDRAMLFSFGSLGIMVHIKRVLLSPFYMPICIHHLGCWHVTDFTPFHCPPKANLRCVAAQSIYFMTTT